MDIILQKTLHGFKPADRHSHEAWQKMERGTYKAKVTRGRNLKFHRKYFALLDVIMDNLPEELEAKFPTIDRLLWEMKLQTGKFDVHISLGGTETVIPHSISFAKMDQDEFEKFYEGTIQVAVKHIIKGIDEQELRQAAMTEIMEFAA